MFEKLGNPRSKNIAEEYKDKITKPYTSYKTETSLMTNGYTLLYDGENDRTDRQCKNNSER
jgi:hypothetical protein